MTANCGAYMAARVLSELFFLGAGWPAGGANARRLRAGLALTTKSAVMLDQRGNHPATVVSIDT